MASQTPNLDNLEIYDPRKRCAPQLDSAVPSHAAYSRALREWEKKQQKAG